MIIKIAKVIACDNILTFLGSYNDITVSRNDDFVQRLVEGKMRDVEYALYDEEGVSRLFKGAYLLSDNGYLKQSIPILNTLMNRVNELMLY
jgi:hypothetical protein